MTILEMFKGKRVKYMTDARVEVILTIKEVKEEQHSRDLEPATRENDWWPKQEDWTTFDVIFDNGFKKTYRRLTEIQLCDD